MKPMSGARVALGVVMVGVSACGSEQAPAGTSLGYQAPASASAPASSATVAAATSASVHSAAPALPEKVTAFVLDPACVSDLIADAKVAMAMPENVESKEGKMLDVSTASFLYMGERSVLQTWLDASTPPKRAFVYAFSAYVQDGKQKVTGWRGYCRELTPVLSGDDFEDFKGFEQGETLQDYMVKFRLKASSVQRLDGVAENKELVFVLGADALGTRVVRPFRKERDASLHFLKKPAAIPGLPAITWGPFVFGRD